MVYERVLGGHIKDHEQVEATEGGRTANFGILNGRIRQWKRICGYILH